MLEEPESILDFLRSLPPSIYNQQTVEDVHRTILEEFEKISISAHAHDGCHYSSPLHAQHAAKEPAKKAEQSFEQMPTIFGNHSIADFANMDEKDFVAFFNRGMLKEIDARISYLLNRREQIYRIMAKKELMHKKWAAKVIAKFEECEKHKKELLAELPREERMKAIETEFILTLMHIDFDHEVEDLHGSGLKMLRTFNEYR